MTATTLDRADAAHDVSGADAANRTEPEEPVRVAACWTEISGYMGACWRAWGHQPAIDLRVIAFDAPPGTFDRGISGIPACDILGPGERGDARRIESYVLGHRPEVVVLPGWSHAEYVRLAFHPALQHARIIMGMDTPLRHTWRQRLARLKIGRYLERVDGVVVAGERSWQYARYLKVPESKLRRGLYGVDSDLFEPLFEQRLRRPEGWPRRFLFAGRYAAEKGIDVLADAYRLYRSKVRDPWELSVCGSGLLGSSLMQIEGVTDHGFVQPRDLPRVFGAQGAFIMPSLYEPWNVAIAEACASGLPVVCTEACGASVELVRPYDNGMVVPTGDEQRLAAALVWIHRNAGRLPEMGRRSRALARAYSAEKWAERWTEMVLELTG